MSRVRTDTIVSSDTTTSVDFPNGLTSASLNSTDGTFSGKVSAGSSITATSFYGTDGTFTNGTFSGNLNVAGVLTYDDVTNVDSVGLVTARSGINVSAGGINVSGIATANGGLTAKKVLVEQVNNETAVTGEFNFYLDEGHLYYSNYNATGDYYPNFKINSSTDLNTYMNNYETVTCTAIIGSNSTSINFLNTIHIDGNAHGENSYDITTEWVGGTAPTEGAGSGYDVYNFTIIKRSDKNFHIFANTNTAN